MSAETFDDTPIAAGQRWQNKRKSSDVIQLTYVPVFEGTLTAERVSPRKGQQKTRHMTKTSLVRNFNRVT